MRDHYQSDTVTSAKVSGAHFILYDTVTLTLSLLFFFFLGGGVLAGGSARGRKPLLLNWLTDWLTAMAVSIQLGRVTRSQVLL